MISNKINDEHLKTFSLSLNKYLRARTLAGWEPPFFRTRTPAAALGDIFFLRFGTSQLTPGDPRGACELRVRGQQPAERAPAVWEVPPRPTPSQQNKSPRSPALWSRAAHRHARRRFQPPNLLGSLSSSLNLSNAADFNWFLFCFSCYVNFRLWENFIKVIKGESVFAWNLNLA